MALKTQPDQAAHDRAAAVLHLIRQGAIDPQLGLSYVIWPPDLSDDDRAGTYAVDRQHPIAA